MIFNVISVRKWRAALPAVTWQVKGLKGTVKKPVGRTRSCLDMTSRKENNYTGRI